MTSKTVTGIASFGDAAPGAGSNALIVAEIDGFMHVDEDGKEKNVFLPGEPVYILVHHASTVRIVRIRATDDGDVQRIGLVSRLKTQQIGFQHPAHLVELSYQPAGNSVAGKWYGRSSNLYLTGRTLQADLAPCLGDISYPISAVQYVHRPINGFSLAPGEEFPIDLVIEYVTEDK